MVKICKKLNKLKSCYTSLLMKTPTFIETTNSLCIFFFFQAEDGIRDPLVTGVQTCALPICIPKPPAAFRCSSHPSFMPNTNPAKMKNPPQSPALSGFQPQNHPLDSTKTLDSQHEHLPPRCYNWRSEEPDERRLPRQYRRVLVARTRLARAQSNAGRTQRSGAMTLFLASVTGTEEAEIAVARGADIIDLKDPAKGALGALSEREVRSAVAGIAGKRPVSAVIGDLPMQREAILSAATAMAGTGIDFVKVGLFPDPTRAECIRALHSLARKTKIIGVMFADLGPDPALIPTMADAGFAGAMLDTARKDGRRLLDHMDLPRSEEHTSELQSRV